MRPFNPKSRQGYFLIFFSLVILMLYIPVWVRTVERDIIVRQDIVRWQQFREQSNILDFALPAIMERKATEFGLGYFKFQEPIGLREAFGQNVPARFDSDEYDDYKIQYNLVGASVIPIPTATFTSGISRTTRQAEIVKKAEIDREVNIVTSRKEECQRALDEFGHNSYPNCNFQLNQDGTRISYGEEDQSINENIQFFYTVPVLGTGNAHNQRCRPLALNLLDEYEDSQGNRRQVDPLDHPCNWNRLEIGKNEVVTIPLFTRDEAGRPVYHNPNLLSLRLRFPCVNGQRYCDPIHRPELKVDEDDISWGPLQWAQNRATETTPRLLDYALIVKEPDESWNYFRPLDKFIGNLRQFSTTHINPDGSIGIFDNYELSQFRARFHTLNESEFLYNYTPKNTNNNIFGDRITNFNLIGDRSQGLLDDPLRHINFLNLNNARSNYQIFNFREAVDDGQAIYPGDWSQHSQQNIPFTSDKELYLTFRVDGFPLTSNPIRTRHSDGNEIELRLQNIEYQLISDKPLGASQMIIRGQVRHPQAGWQRSRRDYIRTARQFDVPTDTGVVFSN